MSYRRASILLGALATVVACGNAAQLVIPPVDDDAGTTGTGGSAGPEASVINIITTPDASVGRDRRERPTGRCNDDRRRERHRVRRWRSAAARDLRRR